ncbi:MAG: CvpA family protein [Wolinella sp.]
MCGAMEGVSYIDIVVVALTVLLGLKGIINGLVREFFGLSGIVGGVFLASRYSDVMGEWIGRNLYAFENQAALNLAGFVAILALFWIAMLLVAEIVLRLVRASSLSGADRLLGFLFASGKIFVIFSIIVYALSNIEIINSNLKRYTSSSVLYPVLLMVGSEVIKLDSLTKIPEEERVIPIPQAE